METDFKEQVKTDVAEQPQVKDNDGVPYCPEHHCRLKRYSGGKGRKVYYKCPVDGCDHRGRTIKTRVERVVPSDPVMCPRCSSDGTPVYCSRSQQFSTPAGVVLQCPRCQWKSNMLAVPSLAAQHYSHRNPQPVEMIGDR